MALLHTTANMLLRRQAPSPKFHFVMALARFVQHRVVILSEAEHDFAEEEQERMSAGFSGRATSHIGKQYMK